MSGRLDSDRPTHTDRTFDLTGGSGKAMGKVVFSSWGNKIVDNRGHRPEDYRDAPGVDLPPRDNQGARIVGVMGWDGIILTDEQVSVVAMARDYMDTVVQTLCQRCTSCRQGNKLILAALDKLLEGNGTIEDVETIEHLANVIRNSAMCSLGQTPVVPILDSLKHFRQEYLALAEGQQPAARTRHKTVLTAPCQNACPIHLDIPGYVELIKGERYLESLALIRERGALPGVLGRVCVHFCEQACRRGALDEPICIKVLKRHVADYEIAADTKPVPAKSPNGKPKVAIVGAGPAGLAAGYYLRSLSSNRQTAPFLHVPSWLRFDVSRRLPICGAPLRRRWTGGAGAGASGATRVERQAPNSS